MKLPFFQFYPLDWLRDTRSLSPQSKGAWIDILAIAWNEIDRGIYKRWPDMMVRELGLEDQEMLDQILAELNGVANVLQTCECEEPNASLHNCTGEITVTSRRMVKLEKAYKLNAERQRKHYYKRKPNAQPNENLTDKTLDVRRYQRLTSTSFARGAVADFGASAPSAPRSLERPETAVLENGGEPELGHQDFVQIGWRKSARPKEDFEWTHLEHTLTQLERVQSKMREKHYVERKWS